MNWSRIAPPVAVSSLVAMFGLASLDHAQVPRGGSYDGMVQVPAGTFDMGRHVGTGYAAELPVHAVTLDAFLLDRYEVTNQEYAEFLNRALAGGEVTVSATFLVQQTGGTGRTLCDTTASSTYSRITWDGVAFGVTSGLLDHAMVRVTWHGACTFANDLSREHGLLPCYDETSWDCDFTRDGYRLPTEAEWEYAARGGLHAPYTMYPWGDAIDGSKANYWNSGDPYEAGAWPLTTPVGYYDGQQSPAGGDMANGYGLYDAAGNVWEWCGDRYGATYYASSPPANPTGPTTGAYRVLRGGGWHGDPVWQRTAFRGSYPPTMRDYDVGFRLAAALDAVVARCAWYCGSVVNLDTYAVGGPYVLGGTFQGTVGFSAPNVGALIAGYLGRATFPVWGQQGLVDVGSPEVMGLPSGIGASPVTITWPVPHESSYAGYHVYTQAAAFGGGVIHLTCAFDCTVGF